MNVIPPKDMETMRANAGRASAFLRSVAQEHRLMILCQLAGGEKSVGELVTALDLRQPTLSQHLARLRAEGLVKTRRDGKVIYYALQNDQVLPVIQLLYEMYCGG